MSDNSPTDTTTDDDTRDIAKDCADIAHRADQMVFVQIAANNIEFDGTPLFGAAAGILSGAIRSIHALCPDTMTEADRWEITRDAFKRASDMAELRMAAEEAQGATKQ